MAEQTGQDRTEKATPKRREEARQKGNVPKSMEVNSVAVLLAAFATIHLFFSYLARTLNGFLVQTYRLITHFNLDINTVQGMFWNSGKIFLLILGPIFLAIIAVSFAANLVQSGLVFSKKAMIPDLKKIDPFSGLKKLFSLNSLVELLKGLLKIAIVAIIGYLVLSKYQFATLFLVNQPPYEIISFAGVIIRELSIKIAIALVVMAAADFAYQRWKYEKDLRMTKQEVKQEAKDTEGNPQVKGKIKTLQRQLSMQRMMAAIPEATVVVTNPTHIAVALKYDPQSGPDAPVVLAKGVRKVAERIKEIARKHNVPIVENKPLARSLFESCEVGMEIPMVYYQAVAEILAQIYREKQNSNFWN